MDNELYSSRFKHARLEWKRIVLTREPRITRRNANQKQTPETFSPTPNVRKARFQPLHSRPLASDRGSFGANDRGRERSRSETANGR
jgi:hypothetical protein